MIDGYNTLRYYEDSSLRRWENADNRDILVCFAKNKIPAFILVSDTSQSTATVQVFNALTNAAVGAAQAVTVTTSGAKKILRFTGFTLTGFSDGCYYSKIVTGASVETYYSEVYEWVTDTASNRKELELLKITATSSDILFGGLYNFSLTGFTYECMLKVKKYILEPDIKERGDEKPRGDIPVYNTRVLKYKFTLLGSQDMLIFLSGLRILETNGSITFNWEGVDYSAYDVVFEKSDSISLDEGIPMTIEFKRTDYISSKNAL